MIISDGLAIPASTVPFKSFLALNTGFPFYLPSRAKNFRGLIGLEFRNLCRFRRRMCIAFWALLWFRTRSHWVGSVVARFTHYWGGTFIHAFFEWYYGVGYLSYFCYHLVSCSCFMSSMDYEASLFQKSYYKYFRFFSYLLTQLLLPLLHHSSTVALSEITQHTYLQL